MPQLWYQPEGATTPADLHTTNREWTCDDVEARHTDLLRKPSELAHLTNDRGLKLAIIQRYKIGLFEHGVYTLPVYDDIGNLINVRYYRQSDHKKWGPKGKTTKLLYPLLGLNGANPLWICEGEFDALMAIQNGLHAITTTAGAPATPATLSEYQNIFGQHRRFVLAFDNDTPGRIAAAHIGLDVFPGRIDGVVKWPEGFKKDISDWYNQGHTSEELQNLVTPFSVDWAIECIEAGMKEYADRGMRPPEVYTQIVDKYTHHEPAPAPPDLGPAPVNTGDSWEGPSPEEVAHREAARNATLALTKCDSPDFDLSTLWPQHGFLREYISYASELTDAPNQFHAATALTIYGTATRRNIYYEMGDSRLFMNFFTAVVAPSSVYRKSTAIKIGGGMLYRVDPALCFPREFSTERLLLHLAKIGCKGMFYFSELAELLDQFKRSYSEGILGLLTDFFDCPNRYERETQKDGLQVIDEVFLSILGASTVEWLNKNITSDQMAGGFWPRFLFFPARQRKPLMELPPPPNLAVRDVLTYRLRALENLKGGAVLTPEAEALFRHWNRGQDHLSDTVPDTVAKYMARLQASCLKIAVLFQVSENGMLAVSEDAMQRSINLCNWLRTEFQFMQEFEIAHDKNEAEEQRLLRMVAKTPHIRERDAMRNMHLSAHTFRSVLDSCVQKEYITVLTIRLPSGRTTIALEARR